MRRRNNWICTLLAGVLIVLSAASCGDLTDFPADDTDYQAQAMHLSLHEAYLMEGDVMQLYAYFEPDSVTLGSIFWRLQNKDCAQLGAYGAVTATSEGETWLYAKSESGLHEDSCLVHIFRRWFKTTDGLYDMVIYARNSIQGKPLSDDQMLAAIVKDEVRGVAQVVKIPSGYPCDSYLVMHIFSESPHGEEVKICLYDRNRYTLQASKQVFQFDTETHGSLSNLIDFGF